MKKLLSLLVLAALLLSVPADADVDLSGMSFDELIALRDQVNLALWATEEWQEVTVPAGAYTIGKEIPAGYWTIRPVDGKTASVSWGSRFDATGAEIDLWGDFGVFEQITSAADSYAQYNDIRSVSWDLIEGTVLVIGSASVIFTPYTGVNLGFK